ncbi:alkaline phosphatase D family protein [Niveispirillum fermenti]|uniref:alkaline phosphatase D family protein n=1 Tax=Niveispirillum fermenti TaxID=1233113 RepID=UPI003A86E82F
MAPPQILLGPILHARGAQGPTGSGPRWRLSAVFLLGGEQEPPDLQVAGVSLPVPPRFMQEWRDLPPVGPVGEPCPGGLLRLWRYDFAVPRGLQDGRIAYGFTGDERRWQVCVPGIAIPPRIAYTACGGCEDEAHIEEAGLKRNSLWARLLSRHRATPQHLMLMGGDQIYADGLWERVPALRPATELKPMKRSAAIAEPDLERQLDAWFIASYRHGWNQPETAAMLASVPGLRMWDDHDIIDGWGSHPAEMLDSPVYKAIYAAARRAFRLFQIGMTDDDPADTLLSDQPPSFTLGMRLNGIGIFAPDLRSERRLDRVMDPATLDKLPEWLADFAPCAHLLVMSSVPLLFPSFALAERLLNLLPGRQAMEDDLRDQWRSPAHHAQWQTMLRHLVDFAGRTETRVTILSGEVHLAAHGQLTGPGVDIHQLVSSGIVHPPPAMLAVEMMERLTRKQEDLFDRLHLSMLPMPGTDRCLLAARNYLTLTGRDDGGIIAEWHAEGVDNPMVVPIG